LQPAGKDDQACSVSKRRVARCRVNVGVVGLQLPNAGSVVSGSPFLSVIDASANLKAVGKLTAAFSKVACSLIAGRSLTLPPV